VGSPSPPPSECADRLRHGGEDYFQPLKRLKRIDDGGSDNNNHNHQQQQQRSDASRTNSSATTKATTTTTEERVKSFSIADILSRDTHKSTNNNNNSNNNSSSSHSMNAVRDTINQLQLHQAARIVRPWDHLQHPISIRPLLPPALLHYEQRLALDYHQQLQEHFRAQAQLLRHMNLEIIPSESGSDRSSSVASDCCSPDIGRSSEHSGHSQQQQQQKQSNTQNHSKSKSPNGTPLDALLQLSNKNFDEDPEESKKTHLILETVIQQRIFLYSFSRTNRFVLDATTAEEEAKVTHGIHESSDL